MDESYQLLVGIDWATAAHQLCVMGPDATVLEERAVEHQAGALHACLAELIRRAQGAPEAIAIAIETPRGALVETLLEHGLHVYALNPKQLDRFRDRHTVAGAKDDRRDAFVLADALRTDVHKFRRVQLDDPLVIQIRELTRADEDLRGDLNRLHNRFREQLYRCASPLLALSPAADEPWFWDIVERITQKPQRRPTRLQIDKILRRHRIRRVTAEQVLNAIRTEPLHTAPGAVEAARTHIALLLPRLRAAHEQRQHCAKQLASLLNQYAVEETADSSEDSPCIVDVMRSLPGLGTMVASTLLAAASQLLCETNHAALRALGGLAPVTKRSGKSMVVTMRHGCDSRLRNAFYHWARTSIQHDEKARHYYTALRARGHSHGRALRSLADRWLRILMAMIRSRTLYDPTRLLSADLGSENA